VSPEARAPSLRLRGLVKRYGARRALDGIDLVLDGPQLAGVVGPDGAGKTTLLRAIAGLLEIEAEEASVLGFDLRGDVRALKAQAGYVPQVFGLQGELSVWENLAFTARLHRLPRQDFERRANDLLARAQLAAFRDRRTAALSGGMRQKLAIANALLPEPRLLVLDEPTAGVDVAARDEIFALLSSLRRRALILLSTSYLEEAQACEWLVYLDAGRVVAQGTPAELRARLPLALYRVWCEDARGLARAARALPFVSAARASGRFARIEVPLDRTPGDAQVRARIQALPGARLVEALPVDMEATLLALAQPREPAPAGSAR
jgi:ABC-type multidrug transport system ATPase subunit